MRFAAILILLIILGCAEDSSEMEGPSARIFDESAYLNLHNINSPPPDKLREIVFADFGVELNDSLLKFTFEAADEFVYTLNMALSRDSLDQEKAHASQFSVWQSNSLSGGFLWRGEMEVTLVTVQLY